MGLIGCSCQCVAAVKAFASEDGASMLRFEVARAKAWGAVGFGVSSSVLAKRAKDNPNFFVSLAATADGKFLPQAGAVVIRDAEGNLLGAVGASGGTGDEDEQICAVGFGALREIRRHHEIIPTEKQRQAEQAAHCRSGLG